MTVRTGPRGEAFSLLELVIVVVIIGIIAAIAVPRLSRGSGGAADSALTRDLDVMRTAIELFATEHKGLLPSDEIVNELTQYTDVLGEVSEAKDAGHVFGPYLRQVPPMPVGPRKGKTGVHICTAAGNTPAQGPADRAWWYNTKTGDLRANYDDSVTDAAGKPYNTY